MPICLWLSTVLRPVTDKMKDGDVIFDPAVGGGNLLLPFDRFTRVGMDIEEFNVPFLDSFTKGDFLDMEVSENPEPLPLIICNPPYNHTKESAEKHGKRNLLPDMFVQKIFKAFGKDQRLVLFTPMGFRLNIRTAGYNQGSRYARMRDEYGKITGIAPLPLDVFHNPDFNPDAPEGPKGAYRNGRKLLKSNIRRKETQQEIIFFNMPELDPCPMIPEIVFEGLREIDRGMG